MAVSAMVTATGTAFETLAAPTGTSAIEARAAFAAAAMFEGAGFGGAIAARIGAAILAAAIVVTPIVVARSTIVVAPAVAARAAVSAATAAAERALEAGTRIAAADASGVAREIFTWCAGSARCTGFAGKQDGFFFDNCANFGDGEFSGFAGGFGMLSGFVLGVRMGFFMSGFGIGFRLFGGTEAFDRFLLNLKLFLFVVLFGIVVVIVRMLRLVLFVVFFVIVLFEGFATSDGFRCGKRFLILGFDEFRGERGDLVIVEIDFAAHGRFRFFRLAGDGQHQRSFFRFGVVRLIRGRESLLFRSGAAISYAFFGEQPAGESPREAARSADGRAGLFGRGAGWRDVHRPVGQKIFSAWLWLVVNFRLYALHRSGRSWGLAAIFGERFAG